MFGGSLVTTSLLGLQTATLFQDSLISFAKAFPLDSPSSPGFESLTPNSEVSATVPLAFYLLFLSQMCAQLGVLFLVFSHLAGSSITLHVPRSLSFRPQPAGGHVHGETSLASQSPAYSYSPSYPLGRFSSWSLALPARILFTPALHMVTCSPQACLYVFNIK